MEIEKNNFGIVTGKTLRLSDISAVHIWSKSVFLSCRVRVEFTRNDRLCKASDNP